MAILRNKISQVFTESRFTPYVVERLIRQNVVFEKLLNARRWYAKFSVPVSMSQWKSKIKSEWWVVDGEMHEIGDDIPPRERFHIPRDNIPNRKRKQMRAQFMRKTRLTLKDSDHEAWCKQYIALYQELRENWEKLYWDEGYSKKVAQEHAAHDSEEDDDEDFSPNRRRSFSPAQMKAGVDVYDRLNYNQGKISYLRDKLQNEKERRFRERAFAHMDSERSDQHHGRSFNVHEGRSLNQYQNSFKGEPLNIRKFFDDRSR